ncbi:DNA gyrase/topoisomerase IV subunit B [Mycoplasma suis]|uniref:DNA topoisomerase (ATP-hydrolyzing) n=1 Tax=Mycoplasma suis (strain Illinois) TaxID=768700 RepID=F0QQ04_MYCSL|nr:type IIA DNA topoisomerase subunit B [Mycoplasma suis]ADX97574.1 DNA gyrase, subunit B [Mycoplasma suis str. Illinois]
MSTEEKKLINPTPNVEYGDSSIQVLEGLEAIRVRPGMYIGSLGVEGLHHLIWEALDNAVDEATAGYATEIKLTLEEEHIVSVEDNGRGIPIGINPQTGLSNIVTIFTHLHAGGKFNNSSYKTSGGLHGVGIKCVNALSTFLEVNVCREGKEVFTKFTEGGKLESQPSVISESVGSKTGTKIRWQPDFSVLERNDYDIGLIKERLQNLSYLNKNLSFIFENKNTGEVEQFLSSQGLADWVESINQGFETVHPIQNIVIEEQQVKKKETVNSLRCEVSFQYSLERDHPVIYSFCNNIKTSLGGVHLETVKEGILSCVRQYAEDWKIIDDKYKWIKEDVISGISLVVSVYYTDPSYKGQTKETLISNEIRPILREQIEGKLHTSFQDNIEVAKLILGHIQQEYRKRINREQMLEMSKKIHKENLLGFAEKLADCTIKNPEFSELYIVEGDSAGGSAKGARNREFQAILPIKGKLANASKKKNKIFDNEEVKNLITAIGCSYGHNFDISKLRYNKIILMTDADVDGSHIQVLIMNFFYKYMKPLLENGHVYIARSPLYKASSKKETIYLLDEEEKREFEKNNKSSSYEFSRFKGLGEMSPAQLWETTMDPKRRTFLQVQIIDDPKTQATMEKLMGAKVKPRKIFITENYSKAMIDRWAA